MSLAVRPTGNLGWASGPSGYVTEPPANVRALGWQPSGVANSAYFNWLQGSYYSWQKYLDQASLDFGDGSDGSAVLDGVATVPWAAGPTGFVYKMAKDAFPTVLAIASGVELQSAGFRLYCSDRFVATGPAKFTANGGAGGGGAGGLSGGIGALPGTVGGGFAGGANGNNGGSNGTNGSTAIAAFGGAGGNGGHQGAAAGASGPGGLVVFPAAARGVPRTYSASLWGILAGGGSLVAFNGGAGGGCGADAGSAGGGPGGGGGGVLALAAREISLQSADNLQARGGAGASAVALTGGGGGGGGGGGVVLAAYRVLSVATGPLPNATLSGVLGGPGGLGSSLTSATMAGATGVPGTVFLVSV